jgi:hypothetical protein
MAWVSREETCCEVAKSFYDRRCSSLHSLATAWAECFTYKVQQSQVGESARPMAHNCRIAISTLPDSMFLPVFCLASPQGPVKVAIRPTRPTARRRGPTPRGRVGPGQELVLYQATFAGSTPRSVVSALAVARFGESAT